MRQPIEDTAPESELRRPADRRAATERCAEWLEWFGVTRLVTSAIAVVIVCAGGWWLLRAPQAPPESALPVAAANGSVGATLPLPSTVPPTSSLVGAPEDEQPSMLVVHVAGAVQSPGVFTLVAGSRVGDAIGFAGGATDTADSGALNLAAPLADGVRVYVPEVGEELPAPLPIDSSVGSGAAASNGAVVEAGPVDVNRATAAELERLPGVGPATAAAVIAERDRNGPFVSFADLERVPGIGPAKLAALDGFVVT